MKISNWVGSDNLVAFSRRVLFAVLTICILQLPTAYANQEYNHILTIESPNPQIHAWFGYQVAINDENIIVSEPYADVEDTANAGKVYIYDRDGNLLSTLQSPRPGSNDNFGYRFDLSDSEIIVGAFTDVDNLRFAGEATIFTTTGEYVRTLQPPDPIRGGYYSGNQNAINEVLTVVFEYNGKTEPNGAGLVHLYDPDGYYLRNLTSPNPIVGGRFGATIEVGEGMILIGEYGSKSTNQPQGSGSVYVFDYEGNHLLTLKAPEPEEHALFGASISISSDRIIIGEPWATVEGVWRAGRAYICNTDGECLHILQSPNPKMSANFGDSVDIDGDRLVVGEWDAHVNPGQYEGRAYVYDVDGNLIQNLTAPEPYPRAAFGLDVDIMGGTIVVGECWAGTEEMDQAGRVHVYKLGPPMVAVFEVGNLAIRPSSVEVDKPVTISADVSNTGNSSGTYSVKLIIDGELCEEREITVDAGLTEGVTFTYKTDLEGTYRVEIGGLEGSLEVKKPMVPGFPIVALVLGLMITTVVITRLKR